MISTQGVLTHAGEPSPTLPAIHYKSMNARIQIIPVTMAAILALSTPLHSALVIYEGFDYNAGALSGAYTGTGLDTNLNWQGFNWTARQPDVTAGSLSYGSLVTSNNQIGALARKNATARTSSTTLSGLVDDGDSLWFSVMVNFTSDLANTGQNFMFALSDSNAEESAGDPLGLRNSGSGIGFSVVGGLDNGLAATTWSGGVATASYSGLLDTTAESGQTHFIVGEITFGATDTVNLYLPGSDLSLGSVVATQSAGLTQGGFDRIVFSSKAGTNLAIDEIRFGTSYADVSPVPEPSALALGAFGSLLLLRRRRN